MPDIQITDELDKPVSSIKVDLTHPSSLTRYLKAEALHLAVIPDFLARKDALLAQAAAQPIQFHAEVHHKFQLGITTPEIDVTPDAQVTITANAKPGSSLLDDDPFQLPAIVPPGTGCVGIAFEGSFDAAVSATESDFTFGFDKSSALGLAYYKAFTLGQGEATLGDALGQTLSAFVIPAGIEDLGNLSLNDIAAVSGEGAIQVSGAVNVSAVPNPLASVNLPLSGSVAVQAGTTAGLSASFEIKGSYQIRVRRKTPATIELSLLQKRGTKLAADFSASAGVTVQHGDTELLGKVIGAISTDPTKDQQLLSDLSPGEAGTLADAIKSGLNHSVQVSIDETLTALTDNEAAFQYEIQLDLLNTAGTTAVAKALQGDFRFLTALEEDAAADGTLSAGIRLLNSVFTTTRKRGATFRLNLLGILNYLSVGELIRNSEVLTDATTGDVTISETVTGNRISAISEPFARSEALRKALFDSILVTTTYHAGRAIAVPNLECEHVHFAVNPNTSGQIMSDYLSWFVALNLLTGQEDDAILKGFVAGGSSSCVLRTRFADPDCAVLFFDGAEPRRLDYYLDIGRRALRAMLQPEHQAIDALRYKIVDDPLWPKALEIGANVNLGPLVGLSTGDARVTYLIGDVGIVTDWANSMIRVGALVRDLRQFVDHADPATLLKNSEFTKKRSALQQMLTSVVQSSKVRFDKPWGMVALFWAAGSPRTASAKATTAHLTVQRQAQPIRAVAS